MCAPPLAVYGYRTIRPENLLSFAEPAPPPPEVPWWVRLAAAVLRWINARLPG